MAYEVKETSGVLTGYPAGGYKTSVPTTGGILDFKTGKFTQARYDQIRLPKARGKRTNSRTKHRGLATQSRTIT
jgi:hypothetical protein